MMTITGGCAQPNVMRTDVKGVIVNQSTLRNTSFLPRAHLPCIRLRSVIGASPPAQQRPRNAASAAFRIKMNGHLE